MKQLDSEQLVINSHTIFTIIVGGRIFNLSWKSLVSDGPGNFFTRHFNKTGSKKIYIDRSADTFELIVRHLRGYPVVAKNETQHHDLLNDAYYFDLQKLHLSLNQFVYINVGGTTFRLRWDLFDKDGPHNYFTGPLKHSLFSPHRSLGEAQPIQIQRDPETFRDMIRHLQGYQIHIRDHQHHQKLLSDAQFYLFKNLRDKLSSATINHCTNSSETLMSIKDIRPSLLHIDANTNAVYYKKLHKLLVQFNDVNICCHHHQPHCFAECVFDKPLQLPRAFQQQQQQWAISTSIAFDKDCAVLVQEPNDTEIQLRIQDYLTQQEQEPSKPCSLHANCTVSWFGIEKAIASVTGVGQLLFLSIEKMQVVQSRLQANTKREFLIT